MLFAGTAASNSSSKAALNATKAEILSTATDLALRTNPRLAGVSPCLKNEAPSASLSGHTVSTKNILTDIFS
jgi:hypothetical protein